MNLDALWNYMQIDLEADKFENEMRQAPKRQQLLKLRNTLKELQANMAKLEADVNAMCDRMEAVKDEAERLGKLLNENREALNAAVPDTLDEIEAKSATFTKLLDSLTRYEQELQKIRKDADVRDRQQKEIRVRAAKTKAEFDSLKGEYDNEFNRDTIALKALKANVERATHTVQAADLERYKAIKLHCTPPMAIMANNQCSGCFMSLPLGTLRDLRAGEQITVCDNCGRILYIKE